jgi:hypothetical protein
MPLAVRVYETGLVIGWAAPRFPDSCFVFNSCGLLLIQVLVADFVRRPVAKR